MGNPNQMTVGEMVDLRTLLGKFLEHIESADVNGNHTLVRSTQMTYAFVNSICQHQGA